VNDNDLPGAPASGSPDPIPPADEPAPPVAVEPVEAGHVSAAAVAVPGDGPGPAPDAVHRQNRIAVVGTIALVVALALGGGFVAGRATAPAADDGSTAGIGATPTPAGATLDPSVAVPTPAASAGPDLPSEGNRLGSADAKLVLDYWADFQCPFCRKFAEETIPLLAPYIEDGTVALVHRDFAFIGPESTDAAIAVRCAGREGLYWPMHDAVYAAQDGENEGAFARERLLAIGESVGLDGATLQACLDDRTLLAEVLDDTSAGSRTGIQSTPTLDVNGNRFTGVPDFAQVQAAIEAAVAGASPVPAPTPQPLSDPWAALPTDGRTAGAATAPVTVALWMDYQATGSGTIASALGPELRSRVLDGKVRLELHDLALLGDESVTAAVALRCVEAQDGPTWFVHDVLSSSARGTGSGIYTPQNLLQLAAQLGLDVQAFNACLDDAAVAAAVESDTAEGKAAGLADAPAIIVSTAGKETDRFSGTIDAAKVLAAIDAAAK
jgi:protein-disulfide isomerase